MAKKSQTVFVNITVGLQLAVTILIFIYVGYRLDLHFDKSPLFLCLGAFLGLGAGMYNLIKSLTSSKSSPEKEEKTNEKSNKWL